ncbi:MAG: GGDEF domain-containing protein [Alphaproteobacteria bacterium]|nr:GGDEF domain-containing protein [Alphaproteobacteria bacterium]
MSIRQLMAFFSDTVQSVVEAVKRQYIYIFPSTLSLPMQQRRAVVIQSRLRFLMYVMAAAIPLWSVPESYIFAQPLWTSLFGARILVGLSLAAYLVFGQRLFRNNFNKWTQLYVQLAVVFILPTLFYVYCIRLPDPIFVPNLFTLSVANTYFLLPFVIIACIGFFPLTVLEAALIVTPFLTAYYMTSSIAKGIVWSSDLGMMWVMSSVALASIAISCSQLRTLVELVSYSAYDMLTNCLERRSGEEVFKILWHYSIRKKTNLAVAFVDLDHFKQVNDLFGHEVGDSVLAETAAALKKNLRRSDSVIRWGGEEFLVVLPDANLENASKTMRRVTEKGLAKRPDGVLQTVSIGISERLSETIDDEKRLIQLADERLYRAKASGRSRIVAGDAVVKA